MADFTAANDRFGRRAHEEAWRKVYTEFLPDDMVCVDLQRTERDYKRDEDREARVYLDDLDAPVHLSIQERFRRAEYQSERDATIAFYDDANERQLHLRDSEADLLVYGYYDDDAGRLLETIVVDYARLKTALALGEVSYETYEHSGKDMRFLAIPFGDIRDAGAMLHHYNPQRAPRPIESYTRGEDIRRWRESDYWVTRDGHVWSAKSDRFLRGRRCNGYVRVKMFVDGGSQEPLVHRLVAALYLPEPPSGDIVVDHINEDKADNRAENLRWMDRAENARR